MREWYTLKAKARKELSAASFLSQSGIETYVPQVTVHRHPGKPAALEPFFPGYFFARLEPAAGEIRLARYAHGVLYVLGYEEEPCPVPEGLIVSIQQRLARRNRKEAPGGFRPGERLIITSGPFREAEAIFDRHLSASGRVRVLIQTLERAWRVELHAGYLRRPVQAASMA